MGKRIFGYCLRKALEFMKWEKVRFSFALKELQKVSKKLFLIDDKDLAFQRILIKDTNMTVQGSYLIGTAVRAQLSPYPIVYVLPIHILVLFIQRNYFAENWLCYWYSE